MPSSVDWQSVFLPQAATCFEHVLSMHLPQSESPSGGAEGGGAAAGAALAEVSLAAEAAGAALDESAGAGSPESALDFSSDGVSGGLLPPQATHARGTTTARTMLLTEMR
jgi:hypothetical protein